MALAVQPNGKFFKHWSLHGTELSSKAFYGPLSVNLPAQCFCRTKLKSSVVIKGSHPQNADLPRYYSRREKKPFPVPIVDLRRAARERIKLQRSLPRKPVPPPKNGLLVRSLIPLAYTVVNARTGLTNNLRKLMKVVPVHACNNLKIVCCGYVPMDRACAEIHVGAVGHPFKTCRGPRCEARKGLHDWTAANVHDVLVAVDAFHLYDRLGKRITHEERFSIPRIPAVVELCIQAGVDLPDFPTKRRRKPVIRIGKKEIIDANEDDLPDPPQTNATSMVLEEEILIPAAPSSIDEKVALAEETLKIWTIMRHGVEKLMKKYYVRVCGYCPEVHVGPTGHKAQNCGAFKHQQRNGQHGWQAAVLDDLIPPRFVWHVPNVDGPPLQRELKSFYGQAPAVVEICIQAGAEIPDEYKSTMRLDIGIPSDLREAEMVI